jgi:hypothetical protein
LVDVIIANFIEVNLALQATISWEMTMMIVMHAKDQLYHD